MEARTTISERSALKARYLDCLAARTNSAHTLSEVIKNLLGLGVVRPMLLQWGVAAGYGKTTVRSLLSRAFCALGFRQRKVGAGRKPSPEALELLVQSRQRYGNRALRVLRAAYRAGKTQEAGHGNAGRRVEAAPGIIPTAPLLAPKLIEGPQLLPARKPRVAKPRRSQTR